MGFEFEVPLTQDDVQAELTQVNLALLRIMRLRAELTQLCQLLKLMDYCGSVAPSIQVSCRMQRWAPIRTLSIYRRFRNC